MDSLSQIPLFQGVDDATIERQSMRCAWRSYEENELIIDYEDDTRDVRFIIDGKVRIILRIATGKEVILTEMREGEDFGEIAAIDEEGRSANVTALNRTRICAMPQSVFIEMVETQPSVNRAVMKTLATRCRNLNSRLAEHCFLQTKHRLYTELLRLSRPRLGHEGQRSISPPPTQKDLASRIGTRREVVSREIANLKRNRIRSTKALLKIVLCGVRY